MVTLPLDGPPHENVLDLTEDGGDGGQPDHADPRDGSRVLGLDPPEANGQEQPERAIRHREEEVDLLSAPGGIENTRLAPSAEDVRRLVGLEADDPEQ